MEIWDLYDCNRQKIKQTMVRGESFEPETYHLVIHVCIFNHEGEMLIQKRREDKEGWPGMWDLTVGGSAISGDTVQMAAERETLEEIGLELDLSGCRPFLTLPFSNGYDEYFILNMDVEASSLLVPSAEVEQVEWAGLEDILTMIEEGKFIPYHKNLIRLIFDLKEGMGAHDKRI